MSHAIAPNQPWLDRLISAVSPVRALRRAEARTRLARAHLLRAQYEGASLGRRTQGWRSVSTDANAETRTALGRLRDVSRDMVRNNAYALRAKTSIAHNVVGAGIISQVHAKTDGRKVKITELLKQHFDTTDIDADGKHNLYGLQQLAMMSIVESGEVLIRRRMRRSTDGYALPFQLQVIEADFLDQSVDGSLSNGNYAIQGVEFDFRGSPVAYHLFDSHPGGYGSTIPRGKRVTSDFVAHIYRMDRPGQVRGVSWFAPVMLRLRDFADYCDAQLMRQKIAACFAAFVTSNEDAFAPDGTSLPVGPSGMPLEAFEPGMIERLRTGESVTFATPPTTQDFSPYAMATLREIAAGLGVTYEILTGDLSNVNFSSGRMGWIEFQRNIDAWRWNMLIPQALDKIAGWTQEAAALVTGSSEPFRLSWTPPRREMIQPVEEVQAAKDAMRSGLSSRSEEVRKLGFDPVDLDAEIEADNKRADDKGLVFDSDPRRVTSKGVAQKDADPNAPDDSPPPRRQ